MRKVNTVMGILPSRKRFRILYRIYKMAALITLNFLSLNVGSSYTLAGLNTVISTVNYDIILLQEIKMTQIQLDTAVNRYGFLSKVNINEENQHKPGTALLWKKTVPLSGVVNLVEGKLQMAELGQYKIFNCYAPSGSGNKRGRSIFYGEDIFKFLRLNPGAQWLVGGDHNCVIRRADIEGGIGFAAKNCEELKNLVRCEKWVDCFVHQNAGRQEFTFHRPGKAKSRLDRFYVSEDLAHQLVEVQHVPSLSDHMGVALKIGIKADVSRVRHKKNFTYWKLNNKILQDDEFYPSFKALWSVLIKAKNDFYDIADWWDLHAKPEIKKFAIGFSSYRLDKRNQTKNVLLHALKIMKEQND